MTTQDLTLVAASGLNALLMAWHVWERTARLRSFLFLLKGELPMSNVNLAALLPVAFTLAQAAVEIEQAETNPNLDAGAKKQAVIDGLTKVIKAVEPFAGNKASLIDAVVTPANLSLAYDVVASGEKAFEVLTHQPPAS
jgi:hypothetical protein